MWLHIQLVNLMFKKNAFFNYNVFKKVSHTYCMSQYSLIWIVLTWIIVWRNNICERIDLSWVQMHKQFVYPFINHVVSHYYFIDLSNLYQENNFYICVYLWVSSVGVFRTRDICFSIFIVSWDCILTNEQQGIIETAPLFLGCIYLL